MHVEVALKCIECDIEAHLSNRLTLFIAQNKLPINETIQNDGDKLHSISGEWPISAHEDIELFKRIECILLETDAKTDCSDMQYVYHFYKAIKREMELATFDAEADAAGDAEVLPSFGHWLLPSRAFMNMWENLVYAPGVKETLYKYILTAIKFGQCNLNNKIINCNRLMLLHGPPGTGKTSLCKALAQKLAIRSQNIYKHAHLIEINSHSLFSKWFSESGKLVMRLFTEIRELIADDNNLVCVLVDEVESLAYARDNMSGQEPKDAMRVVNALLTQLDSLKEYSNVCIMTTSNLANSIDVAFIDRADINQYIGLPNELAIKNILCSMLHEMMRAKLVTPFENTTINQSIHQMDSLLKNIASLICRAEYSGRSLRKLPFLAYFDFLNEQPNVLLFVDAMKSTVIEQLDKSKVEC